MLSQRCLVPQDGSPKRLSHRYFPIFPTKETESKSRQVTIKSSHTVLPGVRLEQSMRVHRRSHISATWQRMYEGASLAFAWDNSRIISAASSLQRPPVSRAMTTIYSGLTLPPLGMSSPSLPALSTAPLHLCLLRVGEPRLRNSTHSATSRPRRAALSRNKASLGQGLRSAVRPRRPPRHSCP